MDILDELKMLADHIDDENNGKPDALSLQLIGAIAEIRKLRAENERLRADAAQADRGCKSRRWRDGGSGRHAFAC